MKRILLVFAHPDDESFSCGLTVPKYVKAGWTVSLVVATSGEEGRTGPYGSVSPSELGKIRTNELSEAAKILGISDITNLGYHDGLVNNEHAGVLENTLYRTMVEVSPDIVITHDPTGITNHPDHIRMSFSTTFAFQKYSQEIENVRTFVEKVEQRDPNIHVRNFVSKHSYALKQEQFASIVESDGIPKLYYTCVPGSVVSYLQKKEVMPKESFGKSLVGTPDKFITTVIENAPQKLIKLKALAKHKSQSEDVDRFYEDETRPTITREFFILRMHGTTEVFMGKHDAVATSL